MAIAEKIPKWEGDLWSFVSEGDGEQCPLFSHCQIKYKRDWCPSNELERVARLILDDTRFNLKHYDFIKYGKCGRISKAVETLAKRFLTKGRVHFPPTPTELIKLVDEQHNIEIRKLPLRACHGAIWRTNEGWVIQLRKDDSRARQRFTLFHEAFHILAHCKSTPVFNKGGAKRGSFNEMLADYFAASVLMPEDWVRGKWADIEDVNMMARIFVVPKSAMCVRLRYLGLI